MSVNTNLSYGGITYTRDNPWKHITDGVSGFATGLSSFGKDVVNMGEAQKQRTNENTYRALRAKLDDYNDAMGYNEQLKDELKRRQAEDLANYNADKAVEDQHVAHLIDEQRKAWALDHPELVYNEGMSKDDVKKLQDALVKAGYSVGKAGSDGVFGDNSKKALEAYTKDNAFNEDAARETAYSTMTNRLPAYVDKYAADIERLDNFTKEHGMSDADKWSIALQMKALGHSELYDDMVREQNRTDNLNREAAANERERVAKETEELKARNEKTKALDLKAKQTMNAIKSHTTKGYANLDNYNANGLAIEDALAELESDGYDTTELRKAYEQGADEAAAKGAATKANDKKRKDEAAAAKAQKDAKKADALDKLKKLRERRGG